MDVKTIDDMVRALEGNREVIGLIEFGSRRQGDNFCAGDYDLFVVLRKKHPHIHSLHFYVQSVPVDLNIVSLEELNTFSPASGFPFTALVDARVIYDPTKEVEPSLGRLQKVEIPPPSNHSVARIRHRHRHLLDKVRTRLEGRPVLCHLVLNTDLSELVRSYFHIHRLPWKGEKASLDYLQTEEPEIFRSMAEFYGSQDLGRKLTLLDGLTKEILAPVGGMWQEDDLLTFGDREKEDLQEKGRMLFNQLFDKQGPQ